MSRVVASSMILAGIAVLAFQTLAAARGQDRGQISGQVIRVIDDASTGDRWLLVKDAADSGGPGRMVRVGNADAGSKEAAEPARRSAHHAANAAAGSAIHPMIHAGDALIVEEHTTVVDARLEATALGSAVVGANFEARLKIGGKVVSVVALAPGTAELMPEQKAHP